MELMAPADRLIRGDGTPEPDWLQWQGLRNCIEQQASVVVPPGRRMVIVAPHPNDELLGTGGLMAAVSARGDECMVVAVTDGEGSHPGSRRWPPELLKRTRQLERTRGLQELGVEGGEVVHARIPDGQVSAHAAALFKLLHTTLRSDDVVFAPWRYDGHPDHESSGRTAVAACAARAISCYEVPIWMWHWARPGDPRVPWPHMLRVPMDAAYVQRKYAALRAHASQLEADDSTGQPAVLPPSLLARMTRPWEMLIQ